MTFEHPFFKVNLEIYFFASIETTETSQIILKNNSFLTLSKLTKKTQKKLIFTHAQLEDIKGFIYSIMSILKYS
jgi:hypothetical protein